MKTPFIDGLLSISSKLAKANELIDAPSVASGLETGLRVALNNPTMVKTYLEGLNYECDYDKGLEEMDASITEAMTIVLEGI